MSADGPQDATPVTRARQRAALETLPFDDTRDFEDAARGFVATLPEVEIKNFTDGEPLNAAAVNPIDCKTPAEGGHVRGTVLLVPTSGASSERA